MLLRSELYTSINKSKNSPVTTKKQRKKKGAPQVEKRIKVGSKKVQICTRTEMSGDESDWEPLVFGFLPIYQESFKYSAEHFVGSVMVQGCTPTKCFGGLPIAEISKSSTLLPLRNFFSLRIFICLFIEILYLIF